MAPSPFDGLIGNEVQTLTPDLVITKTPLRAHHGQPYGHVHGGMLATLAETAASIGAGKASPTGAAVGQSNHTEFLRAAPLTVSHLVTTATPAHKGRSVQVWNVVITDPDGREIAQSVIRLFNVDLTPSPEAR